MNQSPETPLLKQAVLFDWGDTLMVDFAWYEGSMVSWPKVEAVPHAAEVLESLSGDYLVVLVTNAADSGEDEIRGALVRGGLGSCVDRVYCSRMIGHRKPSPEFFQHVLGDLCLRPEQTVMVGDDFENDVLGANKCGIKAVWLNRFSDEIRKGDMYRTVKDLRLLPEILAEFQVLSEGVSGETKAIF